MRFVWIVLVGLVACKKPDAEATAPPAPAQATPSEPAPPTAQLVAPLAPAPAAEPSAAAAPELGPPQAGGLGWQDSSGLVRRQPKSNMRAAEYGVEGDPQAELSVFYFGQGQGGAVEPNIARWIGQFTQPDGSDTAKKAKRSERKVNGLSVALVEAAGSYGGGMGMPGMAGPAGIADAMLLGAIANGPQGPVFFKFTGPRATITRSRASFDALIASLHAQ